MATNSMWGQPPRLTTTPSGGVAILDSLGRGHATLGTNVLTVGTGGKYTTIQSAIDYIATQPAFTAHPYAAQLGSAIASSWVNGTSEIATSTNLLAYPNAEHTWFKFAGDTFYYPYDTGSNRLIAGKVYSAHNRSESGNLAAGSAFNWYIENRFTILLLDQLYHENITISTDANITFTSLNGGSFWSGTITGTGTFKNGRIRFSGIRNGNGLYDSELTGTALSGATFAAANSIIFEHDRCDFNLVSSDWYSFSLYLGSLHSRYSVYNQRPSNGSRGHILTLSTLGDQVFQHPVWNLTNSDSVAAGVPDAYFIDRFVARNVAIAGLRGNIRDKASAFQTIALVGGGTGTSAGNKVGFEHLLIDDCTLAMEGAPYTSGLNIALLTLGANNTTAGEATVHNSTILAPTRGAGTPPTIRQCRIIADPPAAITVNKGANPLTQTYDAATAHVTYVAL